MQFIEIIFLNRILLCSTRYLPIQSLVIKVTNDLHLYVLHFEVSDPYFPFSNNVYIVFFPIYNGIPLALAYRFFVS